MAAIEYGVCVVCGAFVGKREWNGGLEQRRGWEGKAKGLALPDLDLSLSSPLFTLFLSPALMQAHAHLARASQDAADARTAVASSVSATAEVRDPPTLVMEGMTVWRACSEWARRRRAAGGAAGAKKK